MFTRAQLDAATEGIEWRHTDDFLDETRAAYKPVDQVMADGLPTEGQLVRAPQSPFTIRLQQTFRSAR